MNRSNKSNKIKVDYGMPDYYNHYCKISDNPVSKLKYNKIISDFNNGIIDLILNDSLEYKIPHINSTLLVKKDKRKPRIKDGKLINSSPVDWKTTSKLWNDDPDAKKKKILVRYINSHTSGYVFRIYMKKFSSTFKNRSYYSFKTSRKLQRALSARIKDDNKDKFDAYLLY